MLVDCRKDVTTIPIHYLETVVQDEAFDHGIACDIKPQDNYLSDGGKNNIDFETFCRLFIRCLPDFSPEEVDATADVAC